jgi:Zn-finger protein
MKNKFRRFNDNLKRDCFYCGEKAIGVLTFKETAKNQLAGDEVKICSKCLPLHENYRRTRISAKNTTLEAQSNKKQAILHIENGQNAIKTSISHPNQLNQTGGIQNDKL